MTGSRLLAILAALAILSPAAFAEEIVKVSGTGGSIGVLKHLGEAFGKKHPGIKVTVYPSTGSTGGIKAVAAGKLDVAVSSRPIRDEERIPGLVERPLLKTPFLFAASASNPVKGFRMSEIRDIYSGKRTTWPDGRKIRLVMRPSSDAFTAFLQDISAEMKEAVAIAQKRDDLFVGITDQDAADQLERSSASFGVTSFTLVASEKRRIKPLAVDGISPVGANGINGKYPYCMTFYLVYMNARYSGAVARFIDYTHSREGDHHLAMHGGIPIRAAEGKR